MFHCLVIKVIHCHLTTYSSFIISLTFQLVKNFFILFFKFFSVVCFSNSDIISCLQFPVNTFFIFFQLYSTNSLLFIEKNPPHSEADLSYHYFFFASSTILHFFTYFLHALYFIRLITVQYLRSYESKSSQSDICNPLPLRSSTPDNCFVVYQEGLVPLLVQSSPHPLLIALCN